MEQDVNKLAEQLYTNMANKAKPAWSQLEHGGATQSLWIERAVKQLEENQRWLVEKFGGVWL